MWLVVAVDITALAVATLSLWFWTAAVKRGRQSLVVGRDATAVEGLDVSSSCNIQTVAKRTLSS
jgi:hypothetical protein